MRLENEIKYKTKVIKVESIEIC